MVKLIWDRCTKCDSGNTLNPLMHLFLLVSALFSILFLFFGHTNSVQVITLYQFSDELLGYKQVGLTLGVAIVAHTIGFLFRGKAGLVFLPIAMGAGFYSWLYAALVYLNNDLYGQLLVYCLPNLLFWTWYTLQFRRRVRGEWEAFVH